MTTTDKSKTPAGYIVAYTNEPTGTGTPRSDYEVFLTEEYEGFHTKALEAARERYDYFTFTKWSVTLTEILDSTDYF